jgi:hypothetical protein
MFSGARTTFEGVGTGTSVRCDGEGSELLVDDMVRGRSRSAQVRKGSNRCWGRVECAMSTRACRFCPSSIGVHCSRAWDGYTKRAGDCVTLSAEFQGDGVVPILVDRLEIPLPAAGAAFVSLRACPTRLQLVSECPIARLPDCPSRATLPCSSVTGWDLELAVAWPCGHSYPSNCSIYAIRESSRTRRNHDINFSI